MHDTSKIPARWNDNEKTWFNIMYQFDLRAIKNVKNVHKIFFLI